MQPKPSDVHDNYQSFLLVSSLVGALALVVVVVVFQNTQAVETKLLFLTLTLPNAALLFGTLIIGFVIGVLTAGHIVSIAKRQPPDLVASERDWSSGQRS